MSQQLIRSHFSIVLLLFVCWFRVTHSQIDYNYDGNQYTPSTQRPTTSTSNIYGQNVNEFGFGNDPYSSNVNDPYNERTSARNYDPNNPNYGTGSDNRNYGLNRDTVDPNDDSKYYSSGTSNRYDPLNPNRYDPTSNRNDPTSTRYDPSSSRNDPTSTRYDPSYNRNDPTSTRYDPSNVGRQDPVTGVRYDSLGRPIKEQTENSVNYGVRQTYRPSFLESVSFNPFNQPTYFIVASRMVRPGQVYRMTVQVFPITHSRYASTVPISVRASIARNNVEISGDEKEIKVGIPEELLMRVPKTSVPGDYKLRIVGTYSQAQGGIAFHNETRLTFSQRSMTIFVQTDKPVYMQTEKIRFRVIPVTTSLRGFDNAIDVYMVDPEGYTLRRWLSRQSNLGTVSLSYQLSDQPRYGEWTIRVVAQGQIEEHKFSVEEYYQTRYEVNVTMPAFFFNTDAFVYGKIMANYTSGAPVRGNLTIKATIRPIGWFNSKVINQKFRIGNTGARFLPDYNINDPYLLNNPNAFGGPGVGSPYGVTYNEAYPNQGYSNQDYSNQGYLNQGYPNQGYPSQSYPGSEYSNIDQTQDTNAYPNQVPGQTFGYSDQYTVERHFNFDEEWPFWVKRPDSHRFWDPWTRTYRYSLPYLRFFNGTFEFRYPMNELESVLPASREGFEVMITATVGEHFYDEVIRGYAIARVYNSTVRVKFLGGTPQVFKPMMPYMIYLSAQYHDGSPIYLDQYYQGTMEITGFVESRSGGRRDYPIRNVRMSDRSGIWEMELDIRKDLKLGEDRQSREFLNDVQQVQLTANFIDNRGERATADLLILSHHSPHNKQIKISTSTAKAKVGEYVVFHVKSSFTIESFNYILMSKGIVLLSGQEEMNEGTRTMALTLAAEMAPVSTFVVWHVGDQGTVIADSLTFPVNGISRNNFTVYINNRKARTGERVEVAVYGEPGAFVGLSGIDNAFYTMQAGNELTYANVIKKMSTFDEQTNGTLSQTWYSHEGNPDDLVYYPSSSFGIDANRTFEYSGLVVFTDGLIPRRSEYCNLTLGFGECLNGRCYRIDKKCDGYIDCEDGTDEANCIYSNLTRVAEFRKYRFNRIRRHYENVWLWKDINIGPHGRYIFSIEVPEIPALWMVSAFGVSPTMGFGMIQKAIEYVGVQPFFINVEMPTDCRQGEQVGIRVTVFNYQTTSIEAMVVLHGSPDYKFVHVGQNGIVRSYNPVTSFGDQQFFIYLDPQSSTIVYLPIVPQRLGDIHIKIHGETLLGSDTIERTIHVEADGVPQYRHQAILLDLSNRAYVLQYMHVNVTESPIITYEIDRYYVFGSNRARISVVGDTVGPIFPTMPVNATSLIFMPMESAEQNMFSFAANYYNVLYMRLINQRNRTTENRAFYHMNIAYQRQLSFLMPDGSFSLFRSDWNTSASSVWLTAYCARVLQEASFYEWENYLYIDPLVIQRAVRWVLRHQTTEGAFYEVTWLPDRKMNGTLNLEDDHIKYRNISLTAHVLITLSTVKDLPGSLGGRVAIAQQKAIQWLDRNLKLLKDAGDPYEVAITAYALMLAQSPTSEEAFGILASHARTIGEYTYWGRVELPQPPTKLENQKYFSLPRLPYEFDTQNIETTAYALLVYVSRRELFIEPVVRWLIAQRLTDGGWGSTQDTGVALKALIEYTSRTRIRDVSKLAITIEPSSQQGSSQTLFVNDNNLAQFQSIEFPNAWGTVKVQAKGAGFAILQMHVQYNVDIERYQTKPPVPAFDLKPHAVFHGRNQSHISYVSCQRWKNLNESIRSGMAILDVTVPTGYYIQQQKLDSYILSRRVRNLQKARFINNKVLFYFDYLDHEDICVNFTLERWYPVANMSRYLPIRVYDSYAPERFNETIYDYIPTYLLNVCEVCGSSQCPYCSIYNAAMKSPVPIMLIISTAFVVVLRHFQASSIRWFNLS